MKVPQEVIDLRAQVLNGEEVKLDNLRDTVVKLAEMRGGCLKKAKAARAPVDVLSLFDNPTEKVKTEEKKKPDEGVW